MDKTEAIRKLRDIADVLNARKEEAYRGFREGVDDLRQDLADEQYRLLWQYRELEQVVGDVPPDSSSGVPTYVVGSLFLADCMSVLTMDEKEYMVYLTGMDKDGLIYLTTLLHFEAARSVGGVHGDPQSVLQAVLKLERAGHRLYGWFHSHPGSRSACAPSSIDIGMQQRLEGSEYPAIGGVFTRDGYVRFFGVQREFQILIHGKGVEHVDGETSLYKISLPG